MKSLLSFLRNLFALGQLFRNLFPARPAPGPADPSLTDLLDRAEAAWLAGRLDEARSLWEQALRRPSLEGERLAIVHYELGRLDAERGRTGAAATHFRSSVRADRGFAPAALALGDAQEAAGDVREATRTWERAVEAQPALALLGRLERVYRREGRPTRMIALYRTTSERFPDNLAVAAALGRVYLELEMLDEAADQFEKVEVRAPDLPIIHAFLGAVFERRGETREAFDEYRKALRMARAFDWPHACAACGAAGAAWDDRCPACRRWNTLRPARSG